MRTQELEREDRTFLVLCARTEKIQVEAVYLSRETRSGGAAPLRLVDVVEEVEVMSGDAAATLGSVFRRPDLYTHWTSLHIDHDHANDGPTTTSLRPSFLPARLKPVFSNLITSKWHSLTEPSVARGPWLVVR